MGTKKRNRVQGLEDAKEELSSAWDSFHKGDFDAAKSFADRAEELAQIAKTPESYSKALELKQTLTAWIESASLKSEEAIRYVTFAKALIQEANDLIDKKNFDTALQKLLEAQQDLQKAAEAEKTSTEVISLPAFSNLPIIVGTVGAIVVGVVALLLVRRRTRTARAATAVVSPARPASSVSPLAAGKFCISCGVPLPAHAAVCETCGSKQ
jgi:tetratricopeptide (TPR) repeat protein/ribosomal protein L40E